MKRWREEGKDYPGSVFVESPPPVSFVLCISMIKRWWNRAAGRSLDTETMLSLEQASNSGGAAAEGPRAYHAHACTHPRRLSYM